ncbi:VG15 protein [Streptomyces reniochalinae]
MTRDRRCIGWRRVASGSCCSFCAMLASRGAVYKDQSPP